MKKLPSFIILLFIIFTAGCDDSLSKRVACTQDSDCWNSCQYGAVNKTWYEADRQRIAGECLDGCAGVISAKPKCENKKCVAYIRRADTGELSRNDGCTNVKIK